MYSRPSPQKNRKDFFEVRGGCTQAIGRAANGEIETRKVAVARVVIYCRPKSAYQKSEMI